MIRTALSVIAGLLLGFLCVALLETLGMKLFPLPADINQQDESRPTRRSVPQRRPAWSRQQRPSPPLTFESGQAYAASVKRPRRGNPIDPNLKQP
jgi:hypothetical protein